MFVSVSVLPTSITLAGGVTINVMPARIAGGHLLLDHTDETTSSEAASQCRI